MPKQLYLLDTNSATKNSDAYNIPHSFNISFPFKVAIANVKAITLKSVEIPYFISTIRAGNGSNTFSFTFTLNAYVNEKRSVTILAGIYTIPDLITAVNTAITNNLAGSGLTLTLSSQTSSTTGLLNCKINTNAISLSLDNTLLISQVLGYSSNRSTTSANLFGQSPINLSFIDTCIFMQISNLPVVNNNIISSAPPYTFKIPLNNTINNIIYFNDTAEHQTIYFNDNNSFILDKLDIKIYDRYGYSLFGYYDYTLTLLIEYEDNTQKTQFLNLEY